MPLIKTPSLRSYMFLPPSGGFFMCRAFLTMAEGQADVSAFVSVSGSNLVEPTEGLTGRRV